MMMNEECKTKDSKLRVKVKGHCTFISTQNTHLFSDHMNSSSGAEGDVISL